MGERDSTDRQRHLFRQADRQAKRQTDRHVIAKRQLQSKCGRKELIIQTERHVREDRQASRQTDRQTDGQTDKKKVLLFKMDISICCCFHSRWAVHLPRC